MSIEYLAYAWKIKFSTELRIVYMAMADHADQEGKNIFPAIAQLAWKTDMNVRTLQRNIRKLEATGLLVRDRKGNGRTTNMWHIDISKAEMKEPFQRAPRRETRGDTHDTSEVTQLCQVRGDNPTLKNVAEPSDNHQDNQLEADASKRRMQPLLDAIATSIQGIDPEDAGTKTEKLANIVSRVWRKRTQKKQFTSEEYARLAKSIPLFVSWYQQEGAPGCHLPVKLGSFEDWYARFPWRTWHQSDTSTPPGMIKDPDGPGYIPPRELAARQQLKQLQEQNDGRQAIPS